MIDIHTHILPCIDDGSKSPEESIQMLEALAMQGIDKVVLSSHFYAEQESPESYIERRETAYEQLMEAIKNRQEAINSSPAAINSSLAMAAAADPEQIAQAQPIKLPRLIKGAEVCYYIGVSLYENLKQLCIEGTPLFMLEMPRTTWDRGMLREVYRLAENRDVIPLLAHIDRYLDFNDMDVFSDLKEAGALMQINADFAAAPANRRRVKKLANAGLINFIGTDCHGMDHRRPEYLPAVDMLLKRRRDRAIRNLNFYEEEFFD